MLDPNVHPMVEPDINQMRMHVEYLFLRHLDGLQDGKIELAWSSDRSGNVRNAVLFGTDQIEELVTRAVQENRSPYHNIYIGAALRKADTVSGRCGDQDFLGLPAFYADLDEDASSAAIKYQATGCPPTAAIITGRTPHLRAQLLWHLETPEQDPDVCRWQNEAIAAALGGDPVVANPSRILRLAGSIAWPIKKGRVLELTQLHIFDDNRPRVYFSGQLAKAFPHHYGTEVRGPNLDWWSKSGVDLLAEIDLARTTGSGAVWCTAMLRATAHIHQTTRWPNEMIAKLLLAMGVTREDMHDKKGRWYTAPDTYNELLGMLGRADKWERGWVEVDDGNEGWVGGSSVQPRNIDWLWEDRFIRNRINLICGMGDVGKDVFCCAIAACQTTGDLWPDGKPGPKPGIVGIISPEDDKEDTIAPRLIAAGADMDMIRIWDKARRPSFSELEGLSLLIISPLVNMMDGKKELNREQDVREFLGLVQNNARESRFTVIGTAHYNKKNDAAVTSRVLGASGFANFVRSAWSIQRDDEDNTVRLFMRLKANLSPDKTEGLRFRISHMGHLSQSIRCEWEGTTDKTPDEVMHASKQSKDGAPKWLWGFLQQQSCGKAFCTDIFEAGSRSGHSEASLKKAQQRNSKILSLKEREFQGRWYWQISGLGHNYTEDGLDNDY